MLIPAAERAERDADFAPVLVRGERRDERGAILNAVAVEFERPAEVEFGQPSNDVDIHAIE
ncbi:hypothetical protein G4G27_04145 [Sphingomonas sp. So64.6b]|uniref:hypothetical protein n=1 Tax=Sphingomonas sp. So64.6b TaxID=2997354 RepID=UPI0016031739|nr:hypothetical protein [Sphingomonas sp. So64.6b]QNA83286.1 hypothetical protein G4G27_04145 [Sphingomonas sp. So64.6b]